jgi:hypothetical protein
MTAPRAYPWTALAQALGSSRFEALRTALAATKTDPLDRDAFLLAAAVGQVLRDFVPQEAPAESVTSYAALLHTLYLNWDRGWPMKTLDRATAASLLSAPPDVAAASLEPAICYVQLPERLVWAVPAPGAAHEPIDGLFVLFTRQRLRVLAVLGFRPERQGFTTIEADASLPVPAPAARPDGSSPFATVLPAGERMGLFSIVSQAELAALALLALAAARG